jgi:hypothetical protein
MKHPWLEGGISSNEECAKIKQEAKNGAVVEKVERR